MRVSNFTHDFLLLFAGPVVWGLHFLAIYGFMGVVCARPQVDAQWLGLAWSGWVVVGLAVVAAAVLALWLRLAPRSPDSRNFLRWCSFALGGFALVAIGWETLAVFLVPHCAGPQ